MSEKKRNICDAHLHIFKYKEHWSEWAANKWIEQDPNSDCYWLTGKPSKPEDYDGPYELAIEWMDKRGVDKAFLFGNNQLFNRISVPLEYVIEAKEAHPDRFFAFCTPSLDNYDQAAEEIRYSLREKEFTGFKTLPTYSGMDPADPRMMRLYREAADNGGCIVIHTGFGPQVDNKLEWQAPYHLEPIVQEFPTTPISFGHTGFHRYQDAMCMMSRSPYLYGDLAWWHVLPQDYIARALVFAKTMGVIDRLMWGTDFPHIDPLDNIKRFEGIPQYCEEHKLFPAITEEDLDNIFYNNAMRFVSLGKK